MQGARAAAYPPPLRYSAAFLQTPIRVLDHPDDGTFNTTIGSLVVNGAHFDAAASKALARLKVGETYRYKDAGLSFTIQRRERMGRRATGRRDHVPTTKAGWTWHPVAGLFVWQSNHAPVMYGVASATVGEKQRISGPVRLFVREGTRPWRPFVRPSRKGVWPSFTAAARTAREHHDDLYHRKSV